MAQQPGPAQARRKITIDLPDGTPYEVEVDASVPEAQIPDLIQRHLEIVGKLPLPGAEAQPGSNARPGPQAGFMPPGLAGPQGGRPFGSAAPATILNQLLPTAAQFVTPFAQGASGLASAAGAILNTPPETWPGAAMSVPQSIWQGMESSVQSAREGGLPQTGMSQLGLPGLNVGGLPALNPEGNVGQQLQGLIGAIPGIGPTMLNIGDVLEQEGVAPAVGRATGEGVLSMLLGRFLSRAGRGADRVSEMMPSRTAAPAPRNLPTGQMLGLTPPPPPPGPSPFIPRRFTSRAAQNRFIARQPAPPPSTVGIRNIPPPLPPPAQFPAIVGPGGTAAGVAPGTIQPTPTRIAPGTGRGLGFQPPSPRPRPKPPTLMQATVGQATAPITAEMRRGFGTLGSGLEQINDSLNDVIKGMSDETRRQILAADEGSIPRLGGQRIANIRIPLTGLNIPGAPSLNIPITARVLAALKQRIRMTGTALERGAEAVALTHFLTAGAERNDPNKPQTIPRRPGSPNPTPGPAPAPRRY